MKKKLYLLFGLVLSLLLVGVVKAEGPYYLDWETKLSTSKMAIGNLPYKDGYITFDRLEDEYVYSILDKDGKEVKSESYEEVIAWDAKVYGDIIYAIVNEDNSFYLVKYNEDLEVDKFVPLNDYYVGGYFYQRGLEAIYIDSNKIVIPVETGLLNFNHDLELTKTETVSPKNINKYYPGYDEAGYIIEDYNSGRYELDTITHKEGYFAFGYFKGNGTCDNDYSTGQQGSPKDSVKSEPVCGDSYLRLVDDEELDKVWEIKFDKPVYIAQIEFLNNQIAAIVYDDDNNSMINIYDMKGELLQTIESELGFSFLRKSDSGFVVAQGSCPTPFGMLGGYYNEPDPTSVGERSPYGVDRSSVTKEKHGEYYAPVSSCCIAGRKIGTDNVCKSNHQVYYLTREIKSEVTSGRGSVEVASEQRPGEPVTFVVTPDKGYTLGTIKVTDANGNVITFTKNDLNGNTFTMPSADVTIEVEFLVENAATADIAITFIAIVSAFALIMTIIGKKVIKE